MNDQANNPVVVLLQFLVVEKKVDAVTLQQILTFIQEKHVETIGDISRYMREELLELGLIEATVSILENTLSEKFNLKLGTGRRSSPAPATPGPLAPETRPGGGAPPRHILEKKLGLGVHPEIPSYLEGKSKP